MHTTPQPLDFFHRRILPHLKAESVYRRVQFSGVKGRFLRGQCPLGSQPDDAASFWVDMHTLRWSCLAHCGCGGRSPLAFLNGGDFPQPGSGELAAAMTRAVQCAGFDGDPLPPWSVDDERQAARTDRVDALLETFCLLTHVVLLDAVDAAGGPYSVAGDLRAMGFRAGDLPNLPLGLVNDTDVLRDGLRESGFSEPEIDASELVNDDRLLGRIVGPIRAADRRLVSFWAMQPGDREPEFLYKGKWKDSIGFFGLDVAQAGHGAAQQLFVVDHIPDAVLFHSLGVCNAVAAAGPWRRVSRKRWHTLERKNLTQLTLVLDEPAADAAWIDDLAAFYHTMTPVDVYVLPRASLGELGLLHGFADTGRTGQVASVLGAEAVHALAFCAEQILELYRPRAGWNEPARHRAWKHAIEVSAVLAADHADDLEEHFVPVIVEGLGRAWDDFQPTVELPPVVDEPVIEPPPVAQSPVVETPPRLEPPSRSATRRPAKESGECPLHGCGATDCFCFD
jgi:hypothetical protein